MNVIHIAAALLIGPDSRTLLVRKRGTEAFMQPGGKIEPGEPAEQALVRELKEELGLDVEPALLAFLGEFTAPAVHEPEFEVICQLFQVHSSETVVPAAEIEEVIWIGADTHPDLPLAPLTRDVILPLYRQRLAETI
ncbi:NUDIX domain-containing protein [Pseudomonas sp. R1-18]|uniref:NUDIX hydrolase n=1 Tax=Pseudomonas sp. R1-18 TaxID=1632772 RepID=UPI003DA993B3